MKVRKYEWMGNAYFYFGNSMEILIQMVNDLPNVISAYLATVYHCKLYAISIVQDGLPDIKELDILEFDVPEKYLHDFIMRA